MYRLYPRGTSSLEDGEGQPSPPLRADSVREHRSMAHCSRPRCHAAGAPPKICSIEVTSRFLAPLTSSDIGDPLDRLVPLLQRTRGMRGDRCRPLRRNNDSFLSGVNRSNYTVDGSRIVRSIIGEAGETGVTLFSTRSATRFATRGKRVSRSPQHLTGTTTRRDL